MATAIDDGRNLHAGILPAHIQSPDALRTVHLVPRDRSQVDVLLDHIHRNFADRLSRIGVENHAPLVTQLADFSDWLQHANLVIRIHNRDQDGLVIHGALQVVQIDQAVFLHRHVGHAIAIFFQALAGVEHGLVLGDRSDDVVALLAIHFSHAFDGEVVTLGGARGEDNFFRGRAHQFGDPLARRLHALFGCPSE